MRQIRRCGNPADGAYVADASHQHILDHCGRQVPSREMCIQIGENQSAHLKPRLMRRSADMRSENDIAHADQRLGNMRFVLEDIERCTLQPACHKNINQRLFIHQRPSGDVDENTVRSQRLQHLAVDRVFGLRRCRRRDNQDVAVLASDMAVG